MATTVKKNSPSLKSVVDAFNDLKAYVMAEVRLANADLVSVAADSVAFATPALADPGAHNDCSEKTVTAANASNLATSLTLVNDILGIYKFHMADTCAHKAAGVALASYAVATDLATAITKANDVKSKYNTHRASTTYHYTADSTNTVTATNASDLASLITLLNATKTALNAHMASGPAVASLRLG